MQKIEADNFYGTVIKLHLKHNYSCERLLNYIIETFVYPSVNICMIDIDELEKTYNPLIRSESFENILSHPYKLIYSYNRYLDECNKHLKPLNEQKKLLSNVYQELDKLYMWLDVNRDIDEDFSDKDKVKFFRKKLKLITKDIEQIELLPAFELSHKQINEEQLFNDIQYYLDHLTFYKDKIESLIDTNNKKRNMYSKCSRDISQDDVLFDVPWDYCIIVFDSEFSISDIVFDQQIDLSNKMGIVLTHHSVKDFDEGYEYSSINGLLFSDGEICNSISRLSGHYYRQVAHSKYDDYVFIGGMNSDFDFSEIVDECKDQYDGIDEFWIDKVFSLVICESDGFHFYSDVTENELNAKKHRKNDIFIISTLIDNYLISFQDKLSEDDLINVSNLGIILDKDKNLLCQDGIKLQENLFDLFPIGYTKIRCNLTASSKMILNVTRHKISEIHSEINPWIEKTAFCIQKSIFKNVNTILGELSMQCGNCDLNNRDFSNLISNKIRHQFITKVLKS
ncbi:MAG: hypothetical protein IJZ51_06135 [Ruminiclostridium sp.]|nr:hypothetical protein [Ruminiclostridium sp.]